MPFPIPEDSFNALEHARNKLLRANQLEQTILSQFVAAYEDFWGVSGSDQTEEIDEEVVTVYVPNGSRYTVEQMQAVLVAMPMAVAIDVLTDAAQLVAFIDAAYPGVLADRYKHAAFLYTISETGITLTDLSEGWTPPQ
jgi:hypothetical protein